MITTRNASETGFWLALGAEPHESTCGCCMVCGAGGPDGRFYFGTMHSPSVSPRPPTGSLYVLDHDGSIRTLISGVTISNGLAWDKEGKTMYYIDTPTGAVQAFDFDAAKGAISNGRIAFRIPEGTGHPDGCTIDADGVYTCVPLHTCVPRCSSIACIVRNMTARMIMSKMQLYSKRHSHAQLMYSSRLFFARSSHASCMQHPYVLVYPRAAIIHNLNIVQHSYVLVSPRAAVMQQLIYPPLFAPSDVP